MYMDFFIIYEKQNAVGNAFGRELSWHPYR